METLTTFFHLDLCISITARKHGLDWIKSGKTWTGVIKHGLAKTWNDKKWINKTWSDKTWNNKTLLLERTLRGVVVVD